MLNEASSLPPVPKPDIPLPPVPPLRSRVRSGTVSRRPITPPKPQTRLMSPPPLPISPKEPLTPVSRSRTELHALIFGSDMASQVTSPPDDLSPLPSSGFRTGSPPTGSPVEDVPMQVSPTTRVIGLPSHPSMTRRATYGSPALGRSSVSPTSSLGSRHPRNLDAVMESDDTSMVPDSPTRALRRSGSLGRMKTNDELFKKRQSLYNSTPRPRTSQGSPSVSQFPTPTGLARSPYVASPGRPVSKLDTSKYPFR